MPRLTRTAVVDAALDVAYRRGLDSLTIRKIATQLGVSPMAIYWHVKNKDELLDAMGDRVCQDLEITVDPAATWWEQLRTVLEDFMRALRAHPGAADIVVPRMLFSPNSREAMELVLRVLGEAGFSLPDATQLARHGVRVAISLITEPLFTGVEVEPDGVARFRRVPEHPRVGRTSRRSHLASGVREARSRHLHRGRQGPGPRDRHSVLIRSNALDILSGGEVSSVGAGFAEPKQSTLGVQ